MEKEITRHYVKGKKELYYSSTQVGRDSLRDKEKIIHLEKLSWWEYHTEPKEKDSLFALITGPHPKRMEYEKIYTDFNEAKKKCNELKREGIESRIYIILESKEIKEGLLKEELA